MGESYSSADMQSVYSKAPADWASVCVCVCVNIYIYIINCGVQVDLSYKSTLRFLAQNSELDRYLLLRLTSKHTVGYVKSKLYQPYMKHANLTYQSLYL